MIRMMMLSTLFLVSFAVAQERDSYVPKEGFVPDAVTAIRIAEAILLPIYGNEAIARQQPLTASLLSGVWHIRGTLARDARGKRAKGGVAYIELAKDDGRILLLTHGK